MIAHSAAVAPGRVAAIVVNYRTPARTVAAVRSLECSSRRCAPIVVVENGSGDDSHVVLRRELPQATVVAAPMNGGFAAGVNIGVREALRADADLMFLLNSDAAVEPETISSLERALGSSQRAGIAGPVVISPGLTPRIESAGVTVSAGWGRVLLRHHGERPSGQVITGPVAGVAGCAMLVDRQVFDDIGEFTEDYFFGFEDLDFCFRAAAAGFQTVVAADARVWHEGHASIGRGSPTLLYFTVRNHLRFLMRQAPRHPVHAVLRGGIVVLLNLGYVLTLHTPGRLAALRAVLRGAWSHWREPS